MPFVRVHRPNTQSTDSPLGPVLLKALGDRPYDVRSMVEDSNMKMAVQSLRRQLATFQHANLSLVVTRSQKPLHFFQELPVISERRSLTPAAPTVPFLTALEK